MTMAAVPTVAPPNATPPNPRGGDRSSLDRLRRTRAVLAVGALLFGLAGAWTVHDRGAGAADVVSHSGVLTAQAERLYSSLSDADATAATAYLHTGLEPADLRAQYVKDLDDVTAALTAVTAEAHNAADSRADVATISHNLPEYIGEIESARANNLSGYPVGARYLNLASKLMQTTILPAAQHLNETEARDLAAAEDRASALPWIEIGAGALLLLALIAAQMRETWRTNRLLNPGLAGAVAAVLLSAVWLGAAFAVQNHDVDLTKKDGSTQSAVLTTARIGALRARTDEMLTLVGRGSAPDKETAYKSQDEPSLKNSLAQALAQATDPGTARAESAAVDDEKAWSAAHAALRKQDDANDYADAVASALGDQPGSGKASAGQAFQSLQKDLAAAATPVDAAFQAHAKAAAGDLSLAAPGMAVLGLAIAAAVVAGLGRRISEYQ